MQEIEESVTPKLLANKSRLPYRDRHGASDRVLRGIEAFGADV